ncbi:MAG: DUF84 family protein [Acidobacteria bacterium]|nr:DUF84 family protein [Acidobacteriota bacterium]
MGTLRAAKLEAVRHALTRLAALGWPADGQVETVPVRVPSGVSEMPMTEAEGVRGAQQRARAAFEATAADLALGLEGGVVVLDAAAPVVVLRNWAAAWDGDCTWIGSGPGLQLPAELARAVLGGIELGDAIDDFADEHDVRSGRGTFGVLTLDLIDRAHAFEDAVLGALTPWYSSGRPVPRTGFGLS